MDIVYSDRHRVQKGDFECFRGELVPCFEKPARADFVLQAVTARGIGAICEAEPFGIEQRIERVHAPRYLRFLERAWSMWTALDKACNA